MPSTFFSLHYHLVFSTKHRKPLIDASWRNRLHDYLGGTVTGLEGVVEAVGGTDDHVHILVSLRPTHCLADFMRELKKAASVWVHTEIGETEFAWQEGYAAFSVSATSRDGVIAYIRGQEAHHRKRPFREELMDLLQRAGIEFDPKYLE